MRILSKMLQSMIKRAPKSEPEAGYLLELEADVRRMKYFGGFQNTTKATFSMGKFLITSW